MEFGEKARFDQLEFGPDDVKLLVAVLDLVPDLKVCAHGLRLHQQQGGAYPIKSADEVFALFPEDEILVQGHHIDRKQIARYLDDRLFPLEDERSFASAVYLALTRCNEEMAWAMQAPDHANELLATARKIMAAIPEQLQQVAKEGGLDA